MRLGTISGAPQDCVLYLPFNDGSGYLSDWSESGLTATATSPRPDWAPGPFVDALEFSTNGSTYRRVEVADTAAINFTAECTIEFWMRPYDYGTTGAIITRRAQSGGQNDAWAITGGADQLTFKIYGGGTDDSVTSHSLSAYGASQQGFYNTYNSWMHVRCYYTGTNFGIVVNGNRVAHALTSIVALNGSSLGPIQIGAETSTTQTSQFRGRIADVVLRSTADIYDVTSPASVWHDRMSRRQINAVNLDLPEHLQGETWTDDTAGGYFLALSATTLGEFVYHPSDVVSVKGKTTSATTTFAEVGNVTDLDAASNSYFVDTVNRRIYSSEDPTTYTVFEVTVRVPVADAPLARGCRYYRPALMASEVGRREFAYPDHDYPTKAGARIGLIANYSDWPAAWAREEGGNVVWTGAGAFSVALTDGIPWSAYSAQFTGFIDAEPETDSDELAVQFVHDGARFHRLTFEGAKLDRATYPNVYQADEGKTLTTCIGQSLLRIPCYFVDEVNTITISSVKYWKMRWSNYAQASLRGFGFSTVQVSGSRFADIDLDAGTFYQSVVNPLSGYQCWVNVDGIGAAGTPTSTPSTAIGLPFGSASDAYVTPKQILQGWLSMLLSISGAALGSTWTATDGRVGVYLRHARPIDSPSGFLDYLKSMLLDSLTVLYCKPSTEAIPTVWEWEDINKADSSEWTITNADVISETIDSDRSDMVARLNAAALAYYQDAQGRLKDTQETTLALTVPQKYSDKLKAVWEGGLRGHYTKSDVDTWLGRIRNFKEDPRYVWTATLSPRLARVEQMSVLTLSTSTLPSGVGARFRVQSVSPQADGSVRVVAFPETPFQTDGTSVSSTRDAFAPVRRFEYMNAGGQACATGGAWTRVGTWEHPIMGGFEAYPSSVTHRLAARAVRTGGGADTDFKLRLQDVTNGNTLATISQGFATSAEIEATTTFANIPTGDAVLELQYYADNAATGTVYSASWYTKEGSGNEYIDHCAPTTMYAWGYTTGVSVSASGVIVDPISGTDWLGTYLDLGLYTGSKVRLVVRANGTGTSGFKVGLVWSTGGAPNTAMTWLASITGGPGFYSIDTPPAWSGIALVYALITSGTGTLYSIAVEALNPVPE